MIDVNVSLFQWPFRRLPDDSPSLVVARLRACGIERAWTGSFEAMLHRDAGGINQRLAATCREVGADLLIPFGCVIPTLPDWQEDLRRCHEQYDMPGIRLHPNYHGYDLHSPECRALLAAAEQRNMIVQIALKMEDERTQHPLVRVPEVDAKPLVETLKRLPKLRVVLLNSLRTLTGPLLEQLVDAGRLYVDISMLEGVGGLGRLVTDVPVERVLFGSYFPFFNLEAALLKLRESDIGGATGHAIARDNALRMME